MIGLVDLGTSNINSVEKALRHIGVSYLTSPSADDLKGCEKLILPGVGSYDVVARGMRDLGLVEFLREASNSGKPILGICLGMHLLSTAGSEGEGEQGLDLIPGRVDRLASREILPHVGWNSVRVVQDSPLFAGVPVDESFYFVHSYCYSPDNNTDVLAETEYGVEFASAVSIGNVYGVQFHPEKSQEYGLKLLENFCKLC